MEVRAVARGRTRWEGSRQRDQLRGVCRHRRRLRDRVVRRLHDRQAIPAGAGAHEGVPAMPGDCSGRRHQVPRLHEHTIIAGMIRSWFCVVACAMAAACAGSSTPPPAPKAEPPDARVKALADTFLEAYFDRNPESATVYGVPGRHHNTLTDNSLAALRAWEAKEDAWINDLKAMDAAAITAAPLRATYAILRQTLEGSIAKRVCHDELWSVSQMTGWQVNYGY